MNVLIPLEDVLLSMNETSWYLLDMINSSPNLSLLEIRKESNLSQEKCYKELCRLEGGVLIIGNRRLTDRRVVGYNVTKYGLEALKFKDSPQIDSE